MSSQERFFQLAENLLSRIEYLLPHEVLSPNWEANWAFRWRKTGYQGHLHNIRQLSNIRMEDLLCIDHQKQALLANTRQFVARLPANNALLWGPRGTGKSSLVKALVNELAHQGLRVIEVEKEHLVDLPDIVEQIHNRPERFIVYCDDLSFEANDASYKALKVALDGSFCSQPNNVLIYATSNRRHLLPEQHSDNLDTRTIEGEIHHAEMVEEKLSLSERFGIWLAFHPFTQEDYLAVANHWIKKLEVTIENAEEMRMQALQWALLHGTRSGRSAWQFARDYAGKSLLKSE